MCEYCIKENCGCNENICIHNGLTGNYWVCKKCNHNIHGDAAIVKEAKKHNNPILNEWYTWLDRIMAADRKLDDIDSNIRRKYITIGVSAGAKLFDEYEFLAFKEIYGGEILAGKEYKYKVKDLKNDMVELTSITQDRKYYESEADRVLKEIKRLEYIRGRCNE